MVKWSVVKAGGSHILLKLAMRSNVGGQPVGQSRVFEEKNDNKVAYEVELFEDEVFIMGTRTRKGSHICGQ